MSHLRSQPYGATLDSCCSDLWFHPSGLNLLLSVYHNKEGQRKAKGDDGTGSGGKVKK